MTCGFGAAAHTLHATHRVMDVKRTLRSGMIMLKTGTASEGEAMTVEHRKCSVSFLGSEFSRQIADRVEVARSTALNSLGWTAWASDLT